MSILSCRPFAALALMALAAGLVNAGPLNYADGFNVFVFTSLQTTSDIGGRVAAGTTLGGTFEVGTQLLSSPSSYDLVAGVGVQPGSQVKVNSAGNAYVPNGVPGSNIIMNGGGTVTTSGGSPIDFAAARTYFYQLSAQLSQLQPTGGIVNGALNSAGAGLNVFNLTADEYLSLASINTGGGTVIINVSGTPGLNQMNMIVDGQQNTAGSTVASKVLFNFFQNDGTLYLPNVLGGSVLAPGATVAGSFQYNGSIVANALNFTGEIHGDGAFNGDPLPTPEPAAFALAGLGLLGLVFLRRKQAQA